jgi:Tol biopolymer transport system component
MRRALPVGLSCMALVAASAFARGGATTTELVSKTNGGATASAEANADEITPNGRFVVFSSDAANLPGEGIESQIYLRDLRKNKTRLISKTSGGDPADGHTDDASISTDGRLIAFDSAADNLPGLDGVGRNVYVRDRATGKTKLVSRTSGGDPVDGHSDNAMISADGRFVAFDSDAGNLPGGTGGGFRQVYVRDLEQGKTALVSRTSGGEPADEESREPTTSRHGRQISFESHAPNLGGGSDYLRLFVRDLDTGETKQVSRNSAGEPANAESDEELLSASGNLVVFQSEATNLPAGDGTVRVFLRDLRTGKTRLISKTSGGDPTSGGGSSDASISPNERFVVFESSATNLPGALGGDSQVYVRDRQARETRLVSRAVNGDAADARSFLDRKGRYLSGDGSVLLFGSDGGNLPGATGDQQVYVRGSLH